jgi:hypothetical protein
LRPVIQLSYPAALKLLIEQCWSWQPEKGPDFQQIVSILKDLKAVLETDGTLHKVPSSICQALESNDQNKKAGNWIQRLSYAQLDFSRPPPPKLL